jgi:tetratricopeptide (TPR) repeat protein
MESISLDDLDEVDLLLTELEISQGKGNLILCTVASPAYREKVIGAVKARFPARIQSVETGDNLITDLRNIHAEKEDILIWTLPETLAQDVLNALNNFRELFYDAGVPSLVFMTPSGLDDVIWKAPDFWRYRGGYHILKGEDHGLAFQAVEALSIPVKFSYQNKDELLRRKRINEYLLEKISDQRERANILIELGTIHSLLSDMLKAIEYYEQALTIAREIGDRRGEGNARGNLGIAYADLGDAHKAIEYFEQALTIAREVGDKRGEGNALGNLGIAYKNLGDVRKAIECHEQRLVIAREIGDRRGEGNARGNLGIAYADLGDAHKAIEYYEQALTIAREIGDKRGEGNALGNLGIAYKNLGDVCKAIECYELHLVIAREIGDRRGRGNSLWNKSLALDQLGKRAQAIECAKAALKIREEIEDPRADKIRRKLQEWESQQQKQ